MNKISNDLDLDDFEDIESAVLFVKNPDTGEPTSSSITLASKEHPSRKKIDLSRTRKLRAQFNKTGKIPVTDPLDEIEDETTYLVASTLAWNITQKRKPLEFSEANARALYDNPKTQWLRRQVVEALNEDKLFIKASATA